MKYKLSVLQKSLAAIAYKTFRQSKSENNCNASMTAAVDYEGKY